MSFQFLSNNRQHMPVCAKIISYWVRKDLSVAKSCMSLGISHSSAALGAGVHPVGR